jgi:cytochrome c oxidase assembly protein subunit 15
MAPLVAIPPSVFAGVRIWLFVLCALVFSMVVVGGATRLTDSGLSITEWKPIVGTIPPITDADWQDAFEKYRRIPEYHIVNRGMSLQAFKAIFWWEWGHRFLGRLIGVVFALPFLWFLVRRELPRGFGSKLVGLLALGGLQGFIGWYMVQSGLVDRIDVSQYRLCLHLGVAVAILGLLLWMALSTRATAPSHSTPRSPATIRRAAAALLGLVYIQVLLGALVAGLKAGLSHNTWPLMDGSMVPAGLGAMSPWYLNLFENVLTVQFNHRVMGYIVAAVALWHAVASRRAANEDVRFGAGVVAVIVLAQIGLGIWTLLAQVPLALGLLHQAGAMLVFTASVWHLHRVIHA